MNNNELAIAILNALPCCDSNLTNIGIVEDILDQHRTNQPNPNHEEK